MNAGQDGFRSIPNSFAASNQPFLCESYNDLTLAHCDAAGSRPPQQLSTQSRHYEKHIRPREPRHCAFSCCWSRA